jgi:hypothetical protein
MTDLWRASLRLVGLVPPDPPPAPLEPVTPDAQPVPPRASISDGYVLVRVNKHAKL